MVATYGAYLFFVALAVYAQNVTGFALSLILLGLVGATHLFPLPDVVNALSVISLVNTAIFLSRRRALRLEPRLRPVLAATLAGTLLGVMAQVWILENAYNVLRLVLGLCIVGCAWLLWRQARPLPTTSPPRDFLAVGLVSGVMGGLFAVAGPPLVYQLYRQPWDLSRVRESLIFLFGAGALLRLLLVVPTGRFTIQSATLAAVALPIVLLVTTLTARRSLPVSPSVLKLIVCALLVTTGATMVYDTSRTLWP